METQKPKCCIHECDSRDTQEYRGVGTDNLGRTATFVVQLCEPCKDAAVWSRSHTTPSVKQIVSFLCVNSIPNILRTG